MTPHLPPAPLLFDMLLYSGILGWEGIDSECNSDAQVGPVLDPAAGWDAAAERCWNPRL